VTDGPTVIAKLLDLEKPDFNDRMVDFLLEEGLTELLLDHVVRPNEEAKAAVPPRADREPRKRQLDDMLAMKRSYNTMEMVSASSRSVNRFLVSKFATIRTGILFYLNLANAFFFFLFFFCTRSHQAV